MSNRPKLLSSSADLIDFIQPEDTIMWNQGPAEPLALTRSLVEQRAALVHATAFVGMTTTDTLQPEHADCLSLLSYCGLGRNRLLLESGVLDVIPCHYSQLPFLITQGVIPCDVVLLHLSAPGPDGRHSLGIAHDYLLPAAMQARVVIAEINDQMPWTYGSHKLEGLRIDAVVHSSRALPCMGSHEITEVHRRIAQQVGTLVEDGDVLETGIGHIPDAIMATLSGHRELGIHSGMLSDSALDLIEAGVVTNARKTIDCGLTTAGLLLGSDRLHRFARENVTLDLRPPEYTHALSTLARLDNFVAINSAVEVDITGQVNAEVVNGRYVGAVGGQVDFVRGAQVAKNGRSIIALPSTAQNGAISRIVSKLSSCVVTTARSDADVVVTEWGVAWLRGQPLKERVKRMLAITHPRHHDKLEREVLASSRFDG